MKKITLLFALLTMFFANAQWTADTAVNTLVADSTPTGTQSIGTSDGKTYVVFWKNVGAPVNMELRVQLLDANGNQQFGADGMLISNTIPMSTYTVIWSLNIDAKNNLYVAVTGTGAGTPGMVYKISTLGQQVWTNPINLGGAYVPKVLPLANDDILVSYMPAAGGKGKVQRYNASGIAIWPAPIDINSSSTYPTNGTIGANMYEHANGDFTVVFHTRVSAGVTSYLFAQRYNGDGIAQWTQPTQLANMATAYNTEYSGAQDGDVIYYGYSLSHDMRFDSYVQRINADGTTPWGINGKDFDMNQTNYEMQTQIAVDEDSQFVWAICRYTPSSQGTVGEYIQKLDKVTGVRQFTETAKQVFPIDNNFRNHAGNLYLLNDQPLFLAKSGFDNGVSPVTLNAVFLDTNGDFLLEDQMLPVATFAAAKGQGTFNKPANDQAVVVFVEEKTEGQAKIYAQKFSTVFACDVTTVALEDVTTSCAVTLADLTIPTVEDSCGNTITPTTDAVFPITAQGTTTITWTYNALSGDVVTETQNIIINDTTAPELVLQNITVEVSEEGIVEITPMQFNNGSTDACGGNAITLWTWSMTPDSFSCDNLGEQTVTITVTDASGNESTATATITVTDPNNKCTAGVADFNNKTFAVYPNPASDVIYIRPAAGTTVNAVNVYSVIGQKLYSVSNKNTSEEFSLSLNNFQTGTYLVSVETNEGTFTKQIIKK